MDNPPLIFDIKRYAINDGPGIRTTFFVKGCPLRCVWCHNPESWSSERQLLYKHGKCLGCQTCVSVCPHHALSYDENGITYHAADCVRCGRCTEECPTMALELCGHEWTAEALMAEIEKERQVMEDSGGGVTICGGEPLMFPTFLLHLLRMLHERGFHRVVDTSLYASHGVVEQVAAECELMLVDLKIMDRGKHLMYTGVDNHVILDNIRWLAASGHAFSIRIPLIEGVNADEVNIMATGRFLRALPWENPVVHLLPYHDVGKDKHRRMWSVYNPKGYSMAAPSDGQTEHCKAMLSGFGLQVIVGG